MKRLELCVCVCVSSRKLPSIWRHWINRMSTENRYIKAGFDAESWDHCVWFVHASLVGELTKSHNFRISHRYYNIFFFLNIPRNEKNSSHTNISLILGSVTMHEHVNILTPALHTIGKLIPSRFVCCLLYIYCNNVPLCCVLPYLHRNLSK